MEQKGVIWHPDKIGHVLFAQNHYDKRARLAGWGHSGYRILSSLPITRELAVGNPSAMEGQTANILTSRTGLWVLCSTSLLEFEKYLMSLWAETKRRVIPATKFKFFTRYLTIFITYWHCKKPCLLMEKCLIVLISRTSPLVQDVWCEGQQLLN